MSKRKWVLYIAASVIVAGAITYLSFLAARSSSSSQRARSLSARRDIVQAQADSMGNWFRSANLDLQLCARSLEPWAGNGQQTAAARAVLDRAIATSQQADDLLYVVDRHHIVVAASSGGPALVGSSRNGDHIERALSGSGGFSGILTDPTEHTKVVAFTIALHDASGKVTGALIGTTKAQDGSLSRAFDDISNPKNTDVSLVDHTGQAIGVNKRPAAASDQVRHAVELSKLSKVAVAQYKGDGKVSIVAAFASLNDGWVIVDVEPAAIFFKDEERPAAVSALVVALTLAIAMIAIWLTFALYVKASRRADAAKRTLLALAGHELRTPVAVVRGYSQTLVRNWERVPDEQRRTMVTTLYRHSRSLEHLIERLLTGAQLDAGLASAVTIRETDIAASLVEIVAQAQALAPIHTISLSADGPLTAEVDAKTFDLAISHLIENAMKFSPDGGDVCVSAAKRGGRIEIIIEDEGVGLPADISGIFDRFSQSEAVDTRIYEEGGLGLGLFITKTHITRMGGSIKAERRQPKGARFVVTLKGA
ncbi:MAG: ATP-binding protein [Actinomycetota bacterium]|nr:sensor histidine kinase [Actinomycetota bacterium]